MAVELDSLYREIYSNYKVRLLTKSCFGKNIGWLHILEDPAFAYLLHGDELIFNSGLSSEPEEYLKHFIDQLIPMHASGLIVAAREKEDFSQDIISYCNEMQFPLFWADWHTSYLDIMHRFAEILIDYERNETNLIAALKNALSAFQLAGTAFSQRLLSYDELGIYQLLAEVKNPTTFSSFTDHVLGELLIHDEENGTGYIDILESFFQNNCSITQTADALFYHKNTLKYKMKKIKELLGYNITINENRVKIMLALYIRHLGEDFFND